jgi:adenosylcobyric acid synthase
MHNHGIDDEDSVALERRARKPGQADPDTLQVCVIGLPYMSNFTDFTALESQPGVFVYYTRQPADARHADLIILPGSKNTIPDLLWLRDNGFESTIKSHVAAGKPVIGICGGFQMLGREVRDPYHTESDVESVQGLNLLDVSTVLAREKVTRQASAQLHSALDLASDAVDPKFIGYEIHLGDTVLGDSVRPFLRLQRLGDAESYDDGAVNDNSSIIGTYLHGIFDSAEGLAVLLNHWRSLCGKKSSSSVIIDPNAERERRYNLLADHFRSNIKMDVIYQALGISPRG